MNIVCLEQRPRDGMHLGRHVDHDPRSRSYAAPVLPESAIVSVTWERRVPILNQGQVSSCTGNALTGLLGTDSAGRTASSTVSVAADSHGVFTAGVRTLDEAFAVDAYTLNTWLDNIPGHMPDQDTGSSSLACGKTGKALGLLSGYAHAFSYAAMVSALQSGPVLLGIPWYNSMFEPASDGRIRVDPASGLAGGHELVSRQYDAGADEVWVDNSWGTPWGVGGRGYFAGSDLRKLLAARGDVLVPVFASVPPVPPAPGPVATGAQVAAAVRAALASQGF